MAKVWPIADDLVVPAGHRRIAISIVAGALNSAAPFSVTVASSYTDVKAHPNSLGEIWPPPFEIHLST
jgi:hypothetical protein